MSQENVEIMRRVLAAFSQGDVAVLAQTMDPDIRIYPRPAEPDAAAEYRGFDGVEEYTINWYSQWEVYETEPVEIIDAEEHVLAVLRERGRAHGTGVEVVQDFTHSFVLRDGKIVEWHMYDSHADALEAVGLSQ
jgi:ketosteroid isomerase-like protein